MVSRWFSSVSREVGNKGARLLTERGSLTVVAALAAERLIAAFGPLLRVAAEDVVLAAGTAAVAAESSGFRDEVPKMGLVAAADAWIRADVRLELRVEEFDPP